MVSSPVAKKHAPVIAKAKRRAQIEELFDPKTQRKAEREISSAYMELDEKIDTRYQFAKKVYDAQDDETRNAMDEMMASMKRMAGPFKFVYKGVSWGDPEDLSIMQDHMLLWCAVRIFAACAEWDIRIANFKSSKKRCAKCGKKVK
jgi:DNA-binding transcriptional MocR family regulator